MRDRRKIFFCLVVLVITIISEFFLFKDALKIDEQYKDVLKNKLLKYETQLNQREFLGYLDYRKGQIEFEKNKDRNDYGYIMIEYDLEGNISNLFVNLNYSNDMYIDDIFNDAYNIFSLIDVNIHNDFNFDSDFSKGFEVGDIFILNDEKYNLEISRKNDDIINFSIRK